MVGKICNFVLLAHKISSILARCVLRNFRNTRYWNTWCVTRLFREFIDYMRVKLRPSLNTATILRREKTLKFICFFLFLFLLQMARDANLVFRNFAKWDQGRKALHKPLASLTCRQFLERLTQQEGVCSSDTASLWIEFSFE